jgi:hypothetical protein
MVPLMDFAAHRSEPKEVPIYSTLSPRQKTLVSHILREVWQFTQGPSFCRQADAPQKYLEGARSAVCSRLRPIQDASNFLDGTSVQLEPQALETNMGEESSEASAPR